jgi:16S rRNA (guanine1207-N2)-methyltransferase
MGTDHYFTAEPASPDEERELTVELAGREVRVLTAGGVFSPDGVDKGTAVLLKEVPAPPPTGVFLDLGCGWGPLALTLALLSPAATVHAVDVNRRALDLVRRNAAALGCDNVLGGEPEDPPAGTRFDLIWSNPPIRVGKAVLHEMLLTWLPLLAPGGEAWLVVQKNLGADSLHAWLDRELPERHEVTRAASSKGFRVLRVAAPA